MTTNHLPGRILTHPVVMLSTAVLVMNDHLLKAAFPGVVTGKLSDIAGLIVAPAVLVGLIELTSRRRLAPRPTILLTVVIATGFAAVQLLHPMNRLYAHALGTVQWLLIDGVGTPLPVRSVADPLDLLTLPAALVIPWLTGATGGWHRRSSPQATGHPAVAPTKQPPSTSNLQTFAALNKVTDHIPRQAPRLNR